jgi:hypothetical protein
MEALHQWVSSGFSRALRLGQSDRLKQKKAMYQQWLGTKRTTGFACRPFLL